MSHFDGFGQNQSAQKWWNTLQSQGAEPQPDTQADINALIAAVKTINEQLPLVTAKGWVVEIAVDDTSQPCQFGQPVTVNLSWRGSLCW